jgi:nitrogen fixation NifU-like protein
MSELTDLYQEVILDHNRRPRNFGALAGETHAADGYNPLCGDKLKVHLKIADDRVEAISFEGSGCAISKASASLMTDAVKGKSLAEATTLFENVRTMLTTPIAQPVDEAAVGKLIALAGVREFPVRIKCATLSWHTFKQALAGSSAIAKTE